MKTKISALAIILFCGSEALTQDSLPPGKVMTLPQSFTLALKNSVQLKESHTAANLAHQAVELYQLEKLPAISSGLEYGYISNADIWDPSFSKHQTGSIPHQYTQLTVQAGEEIFKGGEVHNKIRKASLEEQIAVLALQKNTEDIKFLVAGQYLDIYKLINLRAVYAANAQLAQERLQHIQAMYKQGKVTQNDVLRTALTLSNLLLTVRNTDKSIAIFNTQMNRILGLPASARLVPDTTLLSLPTPAHAVDSFIQAGYIKNYQLMIAGKNVSAARTNVKLQGSDRYPAVTAFAGTNLQRPFLYNIPAIDMFYNIWQVGIGVSYNISSLYQSPRKIKAARLQLELAEQDATLQRQDMEVDVRAHYIKFQQAEDELLTAREDLRAAEENYRVVEENYYDHRALITDVTDATNAKVDAGTRLVSAEIDRIYAYYLLLKASVGSLGI